ncbi:AAA family ATPase [Streptomyces asoensis]|uniref:AAA family ATPase n=1 Tax=Streptomyces asoensis TaxID=249586 RepID=UPI0033CC874E
MLLSFRAANFRSLKDQQELDLRPVYTKEREALSVAAIYGANASGKSNVLRGLRMMHDAVTEQVRHWQPSHALPHDPFLLDGKSKASPSSFAVDFIKNRVRYSYGFSIQEAKIVEEWLYSYPKGPRRVLFEREGAEYKIGSTVASSRIQLLQELVPEEQLFLTAAAKAKIEDVAPAFDWFQNDLWFASHEFDNREVRLRYTRELLGDPLKSKQLQEILQAADLGIKEVRPTSPTDVIFERVEGEGAPPSGAFRIDTSVDGVVRVLYNSKKPPKIDLSDISALTSDRSVLFEHFGREAAAFPIDEESRGTREWYAMIGFVLNALTRGWTLIIDELDTSLHPILLAQAVRLFQSPETNPRGAQMIFTTHDVSLLGRQGGDEVLRRDEIWFVEKNPHGESSLFPLTDFKPRDGLNWEKRYMGGSVGAVPYVKHSLLVNAAAGRSE